MSSFSRIGITSTRFALPIDEVDDLNPTFVSRIETL